MRRLLTAAAVALLVAGCSSSDPAPFRPGTESFTSSPPGGAIFGAAAPGGDAAAPTPTGPTGPAAPTAEGGDATSSTRAVEEADVYARAGSTLYVLNAYRGLQIVDLSDLAAPKLVGRSPVGGVPVDLYVRDGVAFVLTRDRVEYAVDPASGALRAWTGSKLWAVDVANPASPQVLAELPIEGTLSATRIVGDVLYVVSDRRSSWNGYGLPMPIAGGVGAAEVDPARDTVIVASIDLSDPRAPRPVQVLPFPATGWESHANVTSERITLSFAGWDQGGPVTRFRAIDISDPRGALELGAEASAAGLARDRWGLDFDAATGLFRAVVSNGWNDGARLHVFRWPTVGAPEAASSLALDVAESLTASRFDGSRVYAVTALSMDPLWVIDASDPLHPFVAGHLEMPGQLDHIEPRGDRLVALGHTNEAGGRFRLHVSLIDVANPARPTQLDREIFGPDSGWVPAARDDFRKVFLVLDPPAAGAEGLVVVPYQGWSSTSYAWTGGTQLLSFGRDALALQGFLAHAGDLERAFPVADRKLAALSDAQLQTIDATDLASPVELAHIDLARPVLDLEVVNGAAVIAAGDGWRSGVEVVVTPVSDPDAATPLARLPLQARTARLFSDGDVVWAIATDWQGGGSLRAVDVSNPAQPRARGSAEVPAGAGEGGWWWGGMSDAVLVGKFLAVHQRNGWCGTGCEPKVLVFDLGNPDAPRLAATIPIPGASWLGGLVAAGSSVWAVHYDWVNAGVWDRVRYFADRIELSGGTPRLTASVNIPGMLVAATDDGHLYTWETVWPQQDVAVGSAASPAGPTVATPSTWLHALTLTSRGTASLVASRELAGYGSGFVVEDGLAYGLVTDYRRAWNEPRTELAAVRLATLDVLSRQSIERGWASLVAVAGGKLFLQSGWPAQELLVYGTGPNGPTFEQSITAPGWPSDVEVSGGNAYVAAGPYGVTVIPLAGVSSTP
ncbi:MAG TPA: beta-propeller domain-containing protein [Anaeromyxobacteraceae bacterium]|nr:beta-propeller domain-containing protein [Anaeromyxobacteraceae bacterium]